MKKVVFLLPALAFTLLLAFCQKSEVTEVAVTPDTNPAAGDRGTCKIEWAPITEVVTFCGTNTNSINCNSNCTTTFSNGVETGPFTVTSPIQMSVSTASPFGAWVTLTSITANPATQFIPPGGCVNLRVYDNCTAAWF